MRFVPAPVMTTAALVQLKELESLLGYQKGKDRGVLQSDTLDLIEQMDGALADFVEQIRRMVCSCLEGEADWEANGNALINDFLNFNHGCGDEKDGRAGSERAANAVRPWHFDHPTRGRPGRPNTGRFLFYYMQHGKRGSLRLRRGSVMYEIDVPPGCAVYCTVELLAEEHAHGANGICVSIVSEVSLTSMPTAATTEEIAAAGAAQEQEPLPFLDLWGSWDPTAFLGAKLKYGHGGGGSQERVITALLRGPKLGSGTPRAMNVQEARKKFESMTHAQREASLTRMGQITVVIAGLKRRNVDRIEARKKAYLMKPAELEVHAQREGRVSIVIPGLQRRRRCSYEAARDEVLAMTDAQLEEHAQREGRVANVVIPGLQRRRDCSYDVIL